MLTRIVAGLLFAVGSSLTSHAGIQVAAGDINGDGVIDAVDVQSVINAALGMPIMGMSDIDLNGVTDAIDVQLVINAALGLTIDQDGDGLSDAAEINIGSPPDNPDYPLGYVVTPSSGGAPLNVQFRWRGLAPGSETKGGVSVRWEFGDGNTSDESETNHLYQNPGQYTATMTLNTPFGEVTRPLERPIAAYADNALPSIQKSLDDAVDLLDEPETDLDDESRAHLIALIRQAQNAYDNGEACAAAFILQQAQSDLQFLRQPANGYHEELFNRVRRARFDILFHSQPDDCPEADTIPQEHITLNFEPIKLEDSSIEGFSAVVPFHMARTITSWREGVAFTELQIPGLASRMGETGAPDIPARREIVAVPKGGGMSVVRALPSVVESFHAHLYPTQIEPADQGPDGEDPLYDPTNFIDRPFQLDRLIYEADAWYPDSPVRVTPLGSLRGLDIVQLEVFAGRYNPVTQVLELYGEVLVEAELFGDPASPQKHFLTDIAFNPFEPPPGTIYDIVLNGDAVIDHSPFGDLFGPENLGEEFIILSWPEFLPSAQKLADWKNKKGIVTNVYMAGAGVPGRATKEEIDAFIEHRYHTSAVRPAYVLLLGATKHIPIWYVEGGFWDQMIATDWPYAVISKGGFHEPLEPPSLAVGRIPVDTIWQAQDVVDKIIAYESDPTPVAQFYTTANFAAGFECCRLDTEEGWSQRTFTESAEWGRKQLVDRGYEVRRIYNAFVNKGDPDADPPVPGYDGDPTPRATYYGVPLAPDISPGNTLPLFWQPSVQSVRDSIRSSAFLVIHRNHGSRTSWSHPPYTVPSMHNDLPGFFRQYPVIFSINCSTGAFDSETAEGLGMTKLLSFAERMLLPSERGAVGVIAATRLSPSWTNSNLFVGMMDAMFPDAVPTYGGPLVKRRLGDILNHGKMYLYTKAGVEGTKVTVGTLIDELRLFHVIGDPTLEIWLSNPHLQPPPGYSFAPGGSPSDPGGNDGVIINYGLNGASLTIMQSDPSSGDMIPIGRATVVDGQADIDFFIEPEPGAPLLVSVSGEDFVGRRLVQE